MGYKRTCRTCGHEVSANTIVQRTGQCVGCNNAERRRARADRMPDTLKTLVAMRGESSPLTDWESQFVSGLAQRFESGSIQHLTDGQAAKLAEIADKRLDT